eukprot:TRINITY_DN5229_c0_g1_i1.p1 TRINITY_DN5229_c0_g1~~TRINITY_DN5229_c0_g1_i1.p1  ORF type:complete len:724 (-),score=146.18 TRINITY_DN5229_c0_g1_i1:264-2435(-)
MSFPMDDQNPNSMPFSATNPFAPKVQNTNTNAPTVNQIMSGIQDWPPNDMPTIAMPPTPQYSIATPQYRNTNPFNPANSANNPALGEHRSPTNTNNATNYSNTAQNIYNPQDHVPSNNLYPNSNLSAYHPLDGQHQQLPTYAVPTFVINDVEHHHNNTNQTHVQQHDGPASDSLLSSSPRRSPPSSPRLSHGAATLPRPNFLNSAPDYLTGPPPLPPKDGSGPPPLPPKSVPSSPSVSPRKNNNNNVPQQDDASSFPIHDKHSSIDPLDLVFPEMAIQTEMLREKLHVSRDLKTEENKPSNLHYAPPMSPRSAEQKREFIDAVIASDINKITDLLNQGSNPNVLDDTGRTPLHIAILAKNIEVLKVLLASPRIDPNAGDRTGLTPLHYVAFLQDPVDSTMSPESTRIHTRESDSVKIMILNKLLQHPKIDVNIIDSSGNTPLIFAASSGNLTMVSLLINRGASIQSSTMNGTTPLHAACQEGHYKIVQFLLDLGAQVNVRDNFGDTPLHFAAKANNKDIVAALQRAGAVMNLANRQGRTPADLTTSMDVRWILTGMKTSESNPLVVDFVDNMVLKNSRIGMCMCPGRSKKDHRRNLESDVNVLLRHNAQVLVTLVKEAELDSIGIPNMITIVKGSGIESIWLPIRDKWIPSSMDDLIRLVEQIIERIRDGKVIVVHCNGGKGRTGLVVVATLCGLGMSVDDAVKATRAARPGMIQNPAQVRQI